MERKRKKLWCCMKERVKVNIAHRDHEKKEDGYDGERAAVRDD